MDKKRVLIIDDERAFTHLIKLNLEETGQYIVQEVNRGLQGIAVAKEFKPDIILLDVIMPDIDGGEVASRLKADPAMAAMPIVFLTAAITKDESGTGANTRGGYPFLSKPISIATVIEALEKHIRS